MDDREFTWQLCAWLDPFQLRALASQKAADEPVQADVSRPAKRARLDWCTTVLLERGRIARVLTYFELSSSLTACSTEHLGHHGRPSTVRSQ